MSEKFVVGYDGSDTARRAQKPVRIIHRAALTAAALTLASGAPALAQPIDEKVSQISADSTVWFVTLIFRPFPGTNFLWMGAW